MFGQYVISFVMDLTTFQIQLQRDFVEKISILTSVLLPIFQSRIHGTKIQGRKKDIRSDLAKLLDN